MPRRNYPSRRFLSQDYDDGSPYRDYNDNNYTDHYEDHGGYQDWHDGGGDDNMAAFRRPTLPREDAIHKLVRVSSDGSTLLAGDPDIKSSLFEQSVKSDDGIPKDALPRLLNGGWQIHSIHPGLANDEKFVVVTRSRRPGR